MASEHEPKEPYGDREDVMQEERARYQKVDDVLGSLSQQNDEDAGGSKKDEDDRGDRRS